ncbi:hypothetical protein A2480_02450 [Candidatus Uhrbacteria bacterium RIFOXYC2_FULL_47_19]|uniref:Uncharacterized protein n=1 Tax=Candidatus Uhrbacteria bacterium RIFOXYC2_FULL_47_19 TaxID=1802424 RepID=A0A1F7WCN7_9BACT|nr:MAG: hypothetical protein A2480_02450 [Candidatus Uhrbacteria bacterium RIFOXYC2_FULL_47_19]HCC21991.1 hypothetical protein [Candidatus Uhrbacteria bacterium]
MSKHAGLIKGLAAGAVLGAVAHLVLSMEHKDEKKAAIAKAADRIRRKVMAHAKSVGKLTKTAYGKIVDTTVAEFRGVKDLSEEELSELRSELKNSWDGVKVMFEKKPKAKK